jgi:hypothetical protein
MSTDPPGEAPDRPTLNPVSGILLNGEQTATGSAPTPEPAGSGGTGRWLALGAAVLVPVLLGVGAWQLVAQSSGGSSRPAAVPSTRPNPLPTTLSTGLPSALPTGLPTARVETPATPGPVDVLSPAGWSALTAAVARQGRSTQVLEATVYPTYAVVALPARGGATERFRWDGTALTSFGTTPSVPGQGRVDLAAARGPVVARLSHRIRALVAHPTSWYVLLRTDPVTRQPALYAYANNAAGHGGYLLATPAGAVRRTVTW